MMKTTIFRMLLFLVLLQGCAPKEPVVLKQVKDIALEVDRKGQMLLKAKLVMFNPNEMGVKLKSANIEVLSNGKKIAAVDNQFNQKIKGNSEFLIPLEVKLDAQKNLVGSILNVLNKKKMRIAFVGKVKIKVMGIGYSIPIDHKEDIRY